MAQNVSKTTTDHETIRRWVEERGGWPAEVEATAGEGQTGILRIDFPGYSGEESLRKISWDEWFEKFDVSRLAFVYEDTTASGERSNFNKLVGRETAEARAEGRRTSRRRGAPRGRARGAAARGARGGARAQRGAARAGARAKRGGGRRQASRAEAARTTRRGAAARRGGRGAARGGGRTKRRGASKRGGSRAGR